YLKGREGANGLGGHMSTGYESLKGIMQKTLQHSKSNPMAIARVKDSAAASSLNKEIEELEKIVVDRVGRLRAAVKEGETVVASENQHAEQVIESLRTEIAAQEAQLNAAREKELASQRMEQTLTAKIQDLGSQVKNKEKLLADQDRRVNDLNSQLETLTNGIKGMSSFFKQAEALTVVEAQGTSPVAPTEQSKRREEKPATSQFTGPAVTSNATDDAR